MLGKISGKYGAAPVRDDTGAYIPENCMAGRIVIIAAAKSAAVWVEAKTDMSKPKPVLASR